MQGWHRRAHGACGRGGSRAASGVNHDIAFSPDGTYALVPSFDDGTLLRVNVPLGSRPSTIFKGPLSYPCGVAIAPMAALLVDRPYGDGQVVKISLPEPDELVRYSGFGQTMKMAIAPNGNWALVTNWAGSVSRLDLQSGTVTHVVQRLKERVGCGDCTLTAPSRSLGITAPWRTSRWEMKGALPS